jgi:N-acetylmuramoyl-L-alanine amidase
VSWVTIGRPEDIDLAVPPLTDGQPSGQTLRQIADGYSQWVTKDWARACNVEYRAGASGPSVSLIAEGGKIWTTGDPRWPVMMAMKDGVVIKDSPAEAEIKTARWAFSAGPWLVHGGKICSIADEINKGGYSGFTCGVAKEQAAIGVRPDGAVVHYADMSMTLEQLAAKMLELGCRDAIKLDGGGSVGVVDPTSKLLLGYSSRQVCCALVFRRLIDDSLPQDSQPSQPPQKGGDQMIVCIDPGHGGPDPGAVNPILGLREKDITLEVSKRLAEYLRRAGVEVILTREKDTDLADGLDDKAEMRARAKVANDAKADYLVSVHANSASNPEASGIEVLYWPGSVKGKALSTSILEAMHVAGGLYKRRTFEQSLLLHSFGNMVTVTVEIGFISNKTDGVLIGQAAWRDKTALGIAFGILNMRA